MVGVEVSVGVRAGVSVRVWVGIRVEEGAAVPVGCGVSVGVTEGESEIEGEITNPAVGAADTASVSFEVITEARWTGKLHEIPRTIQIIPITMIHMRDVIWFQMRFISTDAWMLA
jgi:hypothetical protein